MGWLDWLRTISMLAFDLGLGLGPLAYLAQARGRSLKSLPEAAHATVEEAAEVTTGTATDYIPHGLAERRPYQRGKIPVVLIHGLRASPNSWARLVDNLEADPVIRGRYQLWTFGYPTGEPLLYSASLLRQALVDVRRQLDPDRSDPAFDDMVLIGHSMGGLLAKLMVEDSRLHLWHSISARPACRLAGPPADCDLIRRCFVFRAVPEVRRVIYIATPHRGSPVNQGALHWVASRVVRRGDPLRKAYESVIASNPKSFFRDRFRAGIPSSVEQLTWMNQRLMDLCSLAVSPHVKSHSIIADLNDPPRTGGSDGFVPYASAHLDCARSELLVHASHLCQANHHVIGECHRILREHLSIA